MKKKSLHIKKSIKSFSFIIIILCFCGGLSYIVIDTLIDIYSKFNESKELKETISSLKKNEDYLNNEIKKLEDSEYLARYAREKYFYSKDGEFIIRIPDQFN